MKTQRTLKPQERRIFHSELKECTHCGVPLKRCGYWRWDKTVRTLGGVISAARPSLCTKPDCPAQENRYVSADGRDPCGLARSWHSGHRTTCEQPVAELPGADGLCRAESS